MPQTQFKASGLNSDSADKLKDAGMNVAGVQWVNINKDNIVVTHEDGLDEGAFEAALQGIDPGLSLSKV